MPLTFKIRGIKKILPVLLILILVAIFSLIRVRSYDSGGKPEERKSEQAQSTSTSSSRLNSPAPSQKSDVQPQIESQSQLSNSSNDIGLDLLDFEEIPYQSTGETKEEFFTREKRLLANIGSVQFERVGTIQSKEKTPIRESYIYKVKNDKIRVEIGGAVIIDRPDGCYRQKLDSDIFYKYSKGQAEENCKKYTKWNRHTMDEFQAMNDFKILGKGSFEGKKATVVQAPVLVDNTQFMLKGWFWDDNGLTLLAGGVAGDKKVTVEFKNYDFSNLDGSLFEIPSDKVTETSEVF